MDNNYCSGNKKIIYNIFVEKYCILIPFPDCKQTMLLLREI